MLQFSNCKDLGKNLAADGILNLGSEDWAGEEELWGAELGHLTTLSVNPILSDTARSAAKERADSTNDRRMEVVKLRVAARLSLAGKEEPQGAELAHLSVNPSVLDKAVDGWADQRKDRGIREVKLLMHTLGERLRPTWSKRQLMHTLGKLPVHTLGEQLMHTLTHTLGVRDQQAEFAAAEETEGQEEDHEGAEGSQHGSPA